MSISEGWDVKVVVVEGVVVVVVVVVATEQVRVSSSCKNPFVKKPP